MEQHEIISKLSIIKQAIEEKKGGEPLEDWRYSQFQALSHEISSTTGINISHTTLIRLFKKKSEKNIPQLSTLKALVTYLGYKDWESFIQETDGRAGVPKQHSVALKVRLWIYASAFLVITAVVAFYAWKAFQGTEPVALKLLNHDLSQAQVLTFHYKVPDNGYYLRVVPKSFLPYKWNHPNKGKVPLPKNDSVVNYKTHLPAHFIALITKGQKVVLAQDVDINLQDWVSILQSKERKAEGGSRFKNMFFKPSIKNGRLEIPSSFQKHIQEYLYDRHFRVNYMITKDFGIDANAMSFETVFQNISDSTLLFRQLNQVSLLTDNGLVELPLVNPNNTHRIKLWCAEKYLTIKEVEPSKYTFHGLSGKWMKLKIEIADFSAKLFLDDRLVQTISYSQPLGELHGIRYVFNSNGQVDYCTITNPTGDTLYHDDFEQSINFVSNHTYP